MRIARCFVHAVLAATWLAPGFAAGYDGPVEKKKFALPQGDAIRAFLAR